MTATSATASSTRPGPAPRAPHTTTPDPAAPCTAAYGRLAVLLPVLRVHCAPPRRGRGWIPAADLADHPAAVHDLIAHDAHQGLARYGRPLRPDVAAGFALHRFVWPAALLFTAPWFLERRVPLLDPADVSLRRRTGEVTVRPGAFACLPDDPAAGLPQARPVPGGAALAAELRRAMGGFLAPVLAAFRPEVRRGPRVLWAMATDAAVEGLWYVAGLLGEEERARAELTALLDPAAPACAAGASGTPAPGPHPFTPGAGFGPRGGRPGGPSGTDRARASCCLVYTAEPAAMCGGCPRVTRN
ncbi:(2Fe-2S)-binding protein [Streptomyces sp. SP17BM10]|uniref:(2Fe-2S)-binding protein n=1 Tax=Streptomyces sp. SP17BM10 TaxID=3002530 RepID=UPI002E7894F8|nr:(2Fe-2S)-binding protein [Streptomyces sp. SP17BM10]MEE1784968.1 (2Fe-2S)-binding protein [Streptomyces sp. SP17BM10]